MISLRPYEEIDNTRMLEIQKLCPQGDEKWAMGADKKSSIIARYSMYDNWKVLVAEDDGIVDGWIGWTVKQNPLGETLYVYLAEVMVHPDFQRRGIATRLAESAEKEARDAGADHLYGYIYEANRASKYVFERLGYSKALQTRECAIPVLKSVKIPDGFFAEPISKSDVPDMIQLINDFHSGWMHFEPFTPQAFEARLGAIPGYGLENIWAVKDDGRIVACIGLWNSSVLAELYYAREPLQLKILGRLFGLLGHFMKLPKITAEGEHFKFLFLADYAFSPQAPKAMASLLGHFNNMLLERGVDYLVTVLDPADPLFVLIKRLKPQIESLNVYAKSLDGALPEFSPYYLDIRDAIL